MENKELNLISKKLSVLISLLLVKNEEYKTIKDKVWYLKKFNIGNSEIAEILTTSKNTVEVNLTNLKKKK